MSDDKQETDQINLKVVNTENTAVQFKIKKHTPLRKLLNAYCQRSGLANENLRFLFDGHRIEDEHTPKSLHMVEGDIIQVFQRQDGGALR